MNKEANVTQDLKCVFHLLVTGQEQNRRGGGVSGRMWVTHSVRWEARTEDRQSWEFFCPDPALNT